VQAPPRTPIRRRPPGVLVAGLVAGLLWLAAGCRTPPPAALAPPTPPEPYLRVARDTNGTTFLQVALRRFTPPRRGQPELWLAGVAHLGTPEYYQELQTFLDATPLVLYEGIGGNRPEFREERDHSDSLQGSLAHALGLKFQLEAIHYNRPNFTNSDVTLEQLRDLLRPAATNGTANASAEEPEQFKQLVGLMDGSSLFGALARGMVSLVRTSPRLKAAVKVMLVEVLGTAGNELDQAGGLPASWRHLMQVLIDERNKVVVADVRAATNARRPVKSVAVFYGAGHMIDLERRLQAELGFRPVTNRWLTAFSVNPQDSGLSKFELGMVRQMVRRQLEALRPAGSTNAP